MISCKINPASPFQILLLALLGLCYSLCGNAAEGDDPAYTFGVVPQFDVRQIRAIWQPILHAVARESGMRFVIRGAPTIPDFEKEFLSGQFDFAYMNPYHLVLAHEAQGYTPLVMDTGRTLHGVLVVRADSTAESVADLDQKTVAFPAPNALGASLLMRADMAGIHGINIQPSYVKTHSSVYLNVILGDAAAGGGVQKSLNQQPAHIRDQLRVLYRTREVAPHPIAAHSRIPPPVQAKVTAAFLALGETESGRAMLAKIPVKKVGIATITDYEELGDMGLGRYYVE